MQRWATSTAIVLGLMSSACSGHDGHRVLARDVDLMQCAVDANGVFVWGHKSLSRVDRATGRVEFLTNDVHYLSSMIVNDGAVYFVDADGVYVWPAGGATRKVLAEFSQPSDVPDSLSRFGNRVCWAAFSNSNPAVSCYDFETQKVELWFEDKSAPPFSRPTAVAGDSRHLYLAELNLVGSRASTRVLDVSDNQRERVVGTFPWTLVELYATPLGVAFIEPSEGKPGVQPKVWVEQRTPHEISVPLKTGLVATIGMHTYLAIDDASPQAIDLVSGRSRPLSGVYGVVICGDDRSVFATGDRHHSTLIEIPNR